MALGLAVVGAHRSASFLPSPVAVDVAPVTRGLLRVTVDEDGKTRIKERYVVSGPLGGPTAADRPRPGDVVEAGRTLLAVIEPTDPSLLDAAGPGRIRGPRQGRRGRPQALAGQPQGRHRIARTGPE